MIALLSMSIYDAILELNVIPYQYPTDNRAKYNSDIQIFGYSNFRISNFRIFGFRIFIFSDFRISYFRIFGFSDLIFPYFRISGSHISVFSDDTYTLPYICILFVLRKKNNSLVLRQPSSSYQWRQRVNMTLVVIVIWRKRVQIFFILTL